MSSTSGNTAGFTATAAALAKYIYLFGAQLKSDARPLRPNASISFELHWKKPHVSCS